MEGGSVGSFGIR